MTYLTMLPGAEWPLEVVWAVLIGLILAGLVIWWNEKHP